MSINKMTISIQMDNAAFESNKWHEVGRILINLVVGLSSDRMPHTLIDINGNSCGTVVYEEVK